MFVHLHNHTEYSLLDGATKIKQMFEKARKDKMEAVAITDHGNMFGTIEFYKTAKASGIKPIIGIEAYVASDLHNKTDKSNYHLTLWAENSEGYKNLMKLSSVSYLEGFYYKPRIDKKLLREHSNGIIAGSACLKGEIQRHLLNHNFDMAKHTVEEYKSILGKDNFFLEIMRHGLEEQEQIEKDIIKLSLETNTPLVATNDCHYLNREHAAAHDVLLCIQTARKVNDKDRMKMTSDEFYFKTQEEMYDKFSDLKEAVENTSVVAQRCNLEIELGKIETPTFSKNPEEDCKFLYARAQEGLERQLQKIDKEFHSLYIERLNYEFSIIKKMNFCGYLLIVWDFISYAKKNDIPVGPGRGSAAGSLVCYLLGITDINPLKYGLLFERFLNPQRISMPDIDVDFCVDRRQEVIDYVINKYGRLNVAQVITFGTMAAKAVVRDVARTLSFPYKEADRLAKLVPNDLGITIEKAISTVPELRNLIEQDEGIKRLFEFSNVLEGVKRHASTHAAGVVISINPIYEKSPLYKPVGEEVIVTQYSKQYLEDVGLIKFDFLGLKNLTIIDITARIAGIDINNIPLDDEKTYKLLQEGKTKGIFQLESEGMHSLIKELKPTQFEDIIALVALYRPGPLGSGMVKDFIDRKHGLKKIEYPVPELKDILEKTYGVILYQEQVMQIAEKLAGYSLGEADILRRAMGKKEKNIMKQQREAFITRSVEKGFKKKKAEEIFGLIEYFAGYGFNKSHSAAYAYIAYQTAYLKTHFPAELMAALMTAEKDNDSRAKYIEECRDMSIDVLPPDIDESNINFRVVRSNSKTSIRFGLGAIKNVGSAAAAEILKERGKGSFASFSDFLRRVNLGKVNKKVVESLIKVGCFDSLGTNRKELLSNINDAYSQVVQEGHMMSKTLFGTPEPAVKPIQDINLSKPEMLRYEKELLGVYITENPLEGYKALINSIITADTEKIKDLPAGEILTMAGVTQEIRKKRLANKENMAWLKMQDLKGMTKVTLFSSQYAKYHAIVESGEPYILQGEIDKTGNDTGIIAHRLWSLNSINESIKRIVINLDAADKVEKTHIHKFKQIVTNHKGSVPIEFHVKTDKETLIIETSYTCNPSNSFIEESETLFARSVIHYHLKDELSQNNLS